MVKSKPLKIRLFVPNGRGGYEDYLSLPAAQREALSRRYSDRMGAALNEYFTANIGEYKRLCAEAGK